MRCWGAALLPVLAAACASGAGRPGAPEVASPEELARLLEARWPREVIADFCRPETRHNPLYATPKLLGKTWKNGQLAPEARWEGRLHAGAPDLGEVTWRASVEEGRLHRYRVDVTRGEDHWLLDFGGAADLAQRFDSTRGILRRIDFSLENALSAYFWAYEDRREEHRPYWKLWETAGDPFLERDAGGRPARYVRRLKDGRGFEIDLDASGGIHTIRFEGRVDPYFNRTYQDFLEHYGAWIREGR